MRGRPPAAPGTRQRRNADQPNWQPVTSGGRVPTWPGEKTDPPEARTYWRTVHKELGGMWATADRMPVYRAAMLHAAVLASTRRRSKTRRLRAIASSGLLEEADVKFLGDLADDCSAGSGDAASARELRELEDRLGISPTSRRRLQWELQRGTGKTDPATAAPRTDAAAAERQTATGTTLSALA
jgi:hypothetical protein